MRQALLDRMRDIRKGAGYYTDLGENVLDARIVREEINGSGIPCGSIFARDEAPGKPCIGGGSYASGVEFVAQAVVGPEDDGDLDRMCTRAKADMKKAFFGEPFVLVGLADELEWGGASKDVDQLAHAGLGVVNLHLIALFDWTSSAA